MKTLIESLLDDEDVLVNDVNSYIIIEAFLKDNYKITGKYTIKDGLVDVKGSVKVNNHNIINLTNGLFNFNHISEEFYCDHCINLKSLKGAPEKCEFFNCRLCNKLVTLEGAPKDCNSFFCDHCINLKSLKGAPEKCEFFDCGWCNKLISLEYGPVECEQFFCWECNNLQSLKGAPKKCTYFNCDNKFPEKYIKKFCNAKKIFFA